MTSLRSLAVLRPGPRLATADEVGQKGGWRGVCEIPGSTPADMAVEVGKAAFAAADVNAKDVQWVLHAGLGPQGSPGWPIHHHIQNCIVGNNGNALEVKQNCAGSLTTWSFASQLLDDGHVAVCTGADNWSWTDRFANSRTTGGEPFSDVANAAVLSRGAGVAKVLGSGSASCASLADDWRVQQEFWGAASAEDYTVAYADAMESRSLESIRESIIMIRRALRMALADARLSPQYVTHFVSQGSGSGQPFRSLAKLIGLPWSPKLHEHSLDHGYLGVSTQAEGLIYFAENGCLARDSIVLLLACEYEISATAVAFRILRRPSVVAAGPIRVMS